MKVIVDICTCIMQAKLQNRSKKSKHIYESTYWWPKGLRIVKSKS